MKTPTYEHSVGAKRYKHILWLGCVVLLLATLADVLFLEPLATSEMIAPPVELRIKLFDANRKGVAGAQIAIIDATGLERPDLFVLQNNSWPRTDGLGEVVVVRRKYVYTIKRPFISLQRSGVVSVSPEYYLRVHDGGGEKVRVAELATLRLTGASGGRPLRFEDGQEIYGLIYHLTFSIEE